MKEIPEDVMRTSHEVFRASITEGPTAIAEALVRERTRGPATITMEQAKRAVERALREADEKVDPLLCALCSLRTERGDMIDPNSAYEVWQQIKRLVK